MVLFATWQYLIILGMCSREMGLEYTLHFYRPNANMNIYHTMHWCIHLSLYFTTLYFKTTFIIRPPSLVPKCDFVHYWTFNLRPPAVYDHIFMVPWAGVWWRDHCTACNRLRQEDWLESIGLLNLSGWTFWMLLFSPDHVKSKKKPNSYICPRHSCSKLIHLGHV